MTKNQPSNMVKYGGYDIEEAQAEQKALEKRDGEYDELVEGRNVRRILPPLLPLKTPFFMSWEHYVEIPGVKRPIVYGCPKKMLNRPCPQCDYASKLDRSGNMVDKDRAFEVRPRRQIRANVLKRGEEEEARVCVLRMGPKIHDALIELREEHGDFTHPIKGYDIIIKRKGTGRQSQYKVIQGRKCPLIEDDQALMDALIADQYDLKTFVSVPDPEDLEEMWDEISSVVMASSKGGTKRRRERAEDAPADRPQRHRRSAQRAVEQDADDDDEAEIVPDDDDDDGDGDIPF